jgi:hypothetical protein
MFSLGVTQKHRKLAESVAMESYSHLTQEATWLKAVLFKVKKNHGRGNSTLDKLAHGDLCRSPMSECPPHTSPTLTHTHPHSSTLTHTHRSQHHFPSGKLSLSKQSVMIKLFHPDLRMKENYQINSKLPRKSIRKFLNLLFILACIATYVLHKENLLFTLEYKYNHCCSLISRDGHLI